MNITPGQFAEILAGIARSQQAIIDAIDSESAGWRNTHLLPKLTVAANLRLPTPRLLDVPSRILLRAQGRNGMDNAAVLAMLNEALGAVTTPAVAPTVKPTAPAVAAAPVPAPVPAPAPAVAAVSANVATPRPASTPAAPTPAPASAPPSPTAPTMGSDIDLGNFFDT